MTETETTPKEETPEVVEKKKPGHFRRQGMNYAKLLGAITALTTAVNGYLDLEKKNALVYQALASKVNNMSTELAEIKGQNAVIMMFVKAELGAEALDALDAMEPAMAPTRAPAMAVPASDEPEAASDEMDEHGGGVGDTMVEVMTESAEPKPEKRAKAQMNVQAYQELPANLEDLVQEQKQLQVQEE